MPLPTNPNAPWPPEDQKQIQDDYRRFDAWYSGSPARLAETLGHGAYERIHGAQREPGLGERFRFWSQQNYQPERRIRFHLPLASDISTTSADLLFSDPPTLRVKDPQQTVTQDYLDTLSYDGHGLWSKVLESAEVSAALGGVYLRPVWDQEMSPRPILTVVHPDVAIPSFRWGRLTEVTFWRKIGEDGAAVYRHLELHAPGRIRHALYEGTVSTIGTRVPLTEVGDPNLDAIAGSLGPEGDTIEGIPGRITAVYVPNMMPNRRHRGMSIGRSDYDGIESLFDGIDETWTSLMRDIRLARARVIVASEYLRDNGPGRGATFDVDREVYEALQMHPDGTDPITQVQFDIRVQEHMQTIEALMTSAVQTAGYNGRTFGIHDSTPGDATAAEVHAAERRSFVTRGKKAQYWQNALSEVASLMVAIGSEKLGERGLDLNVDIAVDIPDGVQETPEKTATTIELLNRAQAASVRTKVALLHPDWDEDRVAEEARQILQEDGIVVDPMQEGLPV